MIRLLSIRICNRQRGTDSQEFVSDAVFFESADDEDIFLVIAGLPGDFDRGALKLRAEHIQYRGAGDGSPRLAR